MAPDPKSYFLLDSPQNTTQYLPHLLGRVVLSPRSPTSNFAPDFRQVIKKGASKAPSAADEESKDEPKAESSSWFGWISWEMLRPITIGPKATSTVEDPSTESQPQEVLTIGDITQLEDGTDLSQLSPRIYDCFEPEYKIHGRDLDSLVENAYTGEARTKLLNWIKAHLTADKSTRERNTARSFERFEIDQLNNTWTKLCGENGDTEFATDVKRLLLQENPKSPSVGYWITSIVTAQAISRDSEGNREVDAGADISAPEPHTGTKSGFGLSGSKKRGSEIKGTYLKDLILMVSCHKITLEKDSKGVFELPRIIPLHAVDPAGYHLNWGGLAVNGDLPKRLGGDTIGESDTRDSMEHSRKEKPQPNDEQALARRPDLYDFRFG